MWNKTKDPKYKINGINLKELANGLIIQNDGLYQLVPLTKQMMEHMSLLVTVDLSLELCEIRKTNNALRHGISSMTTS